VEAVPARRLRTDVSLMAGSKILGLIFNLGVTVVIARELGPGGRGIVAVALSLTLILIQVGSLGIASANPYFIARDTTTLRSIVTNSVWLGLGIGALLIGCGMAVRAWLPEVVAGVGWAELAIAMVCIPVSLLSLFLQSALLGLGRTVAYNLIEVVQGGATLLALLVVLSVGHGGVVDALLVLTGGAILGAVTYATVLGRDTPIAGRPDLGLARRMMRYAFRIYVATLLAFLVIRLDLLLVNYYRGTAQAGIYSVAAAIAAGMYVFPAAVGVNLFPRVARGSHGELSARVFRVVACVYGVACIAAAPVAGPAISLLYGSRFAQATTLFYWLLPGVFSLGMLTVLAHHFAGRGFPRKAMLVWFFGLGVNLALNLLFLPKYGTYIAPLSSSVAYSILLILHMRMFAEESGGYGVLLPRMSDFSLRAPRSA
jgi:O-antigen/teichoic acid export membrane protein